MNIDAMAALDAVWLSEAPGQAIYTAMYMWASNWSVIPDSMEKRRPSMSMRTRQRLL